MVRDGKSGNIKGVAVTAAEYWYQLVCTACCTDDTPE